MEPLEEKREIKTSKSQEEETMILKTSFLVQAASRLLQGQGQDRLCISPNTTVLFFHLKKGRLCGNNMAELELEPKFPGSKTCKIRYSLETQEKDFFFYHFLCPKHSMSSHPSLSYWK